MPGALDGAKLDDLVVTVDHAGVPLGRYPKTLELEDRSDGLHWSVSPPESRADVREAVERGDLKAGSWRMRVKRDSWDGDLRRVHEIAELRDVSIVTAPAYETALVELRSQPNPADGQEDTMATVGPHGAQERERRGEAEDSEPADEAEEVEDRSPGRQAPEDAGRRDDAAGGGGRRLAHHDDPSPRPRRAGPVTPEEVDQPAQMCHEAAATETCKRLYAAIVTDGVFTRILGDHPNPDAVADELGNDKIIELAREELGEMTEDERDQLAGDAADHLRHLVCGVGNAAFRAMKNGILTSDDLTPDFLIRAAAVAYVSRATK